MDEKKSRIERILVEISLGVKKDDSLLKPFSSEELEIWEKLVEQVEEIKIKGGELEIPRELPGLD